jgi:hypothetical protein
VFLSDWWDWWIERVITSQDINERQGKEGASESDGDSGNAMAFVGSLGFSVKPNATGFGLFLGEIGPCLDAILG